MFYKISLFLKKFRKTYKKTPLPEFLSDKIVQYQACNFIKETSAQMFYCESCEIVLSTFFTELFQWVFLISIQPS